MERLSATDETRLARVRLYALQSPAYEVIGRALSLEDPLRVGGITVTPGDMLSAARWIVEMVQGKPTQRNDNYNSGTIYQVVLRSPAELELLERELELLERRASVSPPAAIDVVGHLLPAEGGNSPPVSGAGEDSGIGLGLPPSPGSLYGWDTPQDTPLYISAKDRAKQARRQQPRPRAQRPALAKPSPPADGPGAAPNDRQARYAQRQAQLRALEEAQGR